MWYYIWYVIYNPLWCEETYSTYSQHLSTGRIACLLILQEARMFGGLFRLNPARHLNLGPPAAWSGQETFLEGPNFSGYVRGYAPICTPNMAFYGPAAPFLDLGIDKFTG